MKIRCVIIDDEPAAREGLAQDLRAVEFLEIAGIAENTAQANALITSINPDLLFLDVQMPKITGLEFLRNLKNPPMVILVTAYAEYAIEGFNLDVIDYLLKPVAFGRLLKACRKARDQFSLNKSGDAKQKKDDFFYIRFENKFEKIFLQDILFVEGADNYVKLHTKGKVYTTYLTLKSVEASLPEEDFMKVHKSFIVSMDKIGKIEKNEIELGGKKVPISRNLKEEVMNRIVNRKLIKREG